MTERHSRGSSHHGNLPGNTGSARNGMAIPGGYVRSTADADREREVAEQLTAIRATLGLPPVEPPRPRWEPRQAQPVAPDTPMGSPPEPAAEPVQDTPERCGDCGYLTTAVGHKIMCGDTG